MRIYFSGHVGSGFHPEALVPSLKPHVMVTFFDLAVKNSNTKGVRERVSVFLKRQRIKK